MGKTRNTGFSNNAIQYNSGSIAFTSGSTTLLNISSSGAIVTTGTITANTLLVQTVTSSVSFVTGSTKFGAISSNTHQFTGSLNVTGALYVATGSVGIGTVSPSQLFEVVGGEIKAGRVDTSQEGGQVSFGRSTDNNTAWYIDAYGSTASPQFRFINVTNAAVVMTMTGSNVGVGTSSPQFSLALPQDNKVGWNDAGNAKRGSITVNSASDAMVFATGTGDAERMRITSGGEVLMHSTSFNSVNIGQLFGTGGDTYFTTETGQILYLNRRGNDGTLVDFRRDNAVKGTISVSGETVSYNSFLGSHWSQLIDNSKPEILKGTILEAIDELCTWEEETNDRLPKVKISDTIESKNVYGVFLDWDNDDTINNDMYVAAVGAGYIRVNLNEIVQIGDLLQSNGDGTAKIQSDDIMRSSTIAKVVSTNKIETYEDGSYLIAATLHCG